MDSIHHISISVAEIDSAVHWYTTSFQCELLYQEKTKAALRFENITLELSLPSQEPPHLAFVRDDAASLGELRKRTNGTHSTFIADPTGNAVEIIGK